MVFSKAELRNLSNLFLSVNDDNTRLAFELMEQQQFPSGLLTEVFAVYKLTQNEELKEKAEKLLLEHGSEHVKNAMKWRLKLNSDGSLYGATEKTIAKNINKYCDEKELMGKKLATAMFRKFGLGSYYLLNNVPEPERKENLKIFMDGNVFKLQGAALTKFPPELFEYPDLEEIDLSNNKIRAIPAKIKNFQNLRVLKLSHNNLKSVNKAILQLKKLEELYLDQNLLNNFPEIITELSWLKKLDITGMTNINIYRGLELPESFQKLTNLQGLGLANYPNNYGSTKYYSPYRNYPHLRWVTASEARPLDLAPMALAKTAFEQNGEGVAYILRYCKDSDFIKSVLRSFYDAASQTMDFNEVYLEHLPAEIADFEIQHLHLSKTRIGLVGSHFKTPEEKELGHVAVDKARLAVLSKLTKLKSLSLYDCCLSAFPNGIEYLQQLEHLDARFNYIKGVPQELGLLKNLQILELRSTFSHYDDIPKIPESFAKLMHLQKLSFHFYKMDEVQYFDRLTELLPNSCEIKVD